MPESLGLVLARGVSVAALLSLFGAVVFQTMVAPRALARASAAEAAGSARLVWIVAQASVAVGLVGMLAWLVLQAADMAGALSLSAVPVVLAHTVFGHLVLLQMAALVAAGLALGWRTPRPRLALVAATAALAVHAGHGHAASMYDGPSLLLAGEIVHLLAAGAWLGGLAPLLLVVWATPPRIGAMAARWFSPLGWFCVIAVAASAAFQGWVLVDSIPGLVGTFYGWMVLVKLALFGVLTAFALANRYRFAPALLGAQAAAGKRRLIGSVTLQTGFGLAIVAAAAVLSSTPPAMHVQPVWPFPDLFTLDTISEDSDLRNEVAFAAGRLVAGLGLLAAAVVLRHPVRWLSALGGVIIAGLAVPHFDLLFVPAYPTSFYRSPTRFAAESIVQGAALFPQHCAACHGGDGRGDGPAAKALAVPPADLTAGHLWAHSDGDLFWWLSHGMEGPRGGLVMPGFAGALSEDERWALIDYIRAHNAGVTLRAVGAWSPPVMAPDLQLVCDGGKAASLQDFRGSFVRVVSEPSAGSPGVTTIVMGVVAPPGPGVCIAADATAPLAYAIVAGLDLGEPAQFLIDGNGVLRAVQRSTPGMGWNDPKTLATVIQDLQAHPVAVPAGGHMAMPM